MTSYQKRRLSTASTFSIGQYSDDDVKSKDYYMSLARKYNEYHMPLVQQRHGAFDLPDILYQGRRINCDRNNQWWIDGKPSENETELSLTELHRLQNEELKRSIARITHELAVQNPDVKIDRKRMHDAISDLMTSETQSPSTFFAHGKFDGPGVFLYGHKVQLDKNNAFWIDGKHDINHEVKITPKQFKQLQANRYPEWKLTHIEQLLFSDPTHKIIGSK